MGWLKAAQAEHDAVFDAAHLSTFDRLSSAATLRNVNAEHAPALLAALEKVWAALPDESRYCATSIEGTWFVHIRTILAPLFENPEKTT